MASNIQGMQTTNWFAVLELAPGCNEAEVKAAFRRLALQHHPDKGGQKDLFQLINNAYEAVLAAKGATCSSSAKKGGESVKQRQDPEDCRYKTHDDRKQQRDER